MNKLIKINYNNERQTTSAREFWEFLDKPHGEFMKWFTRYIEYGFTENEDYRLIDRLVENPQGGRPAQDYEITIDMAKELAMLQRTEKGKLARQYFIELEKKWNSPEMIMKRALEFANRKVEDLQFETAQQKQIIGELQPKATYYDLILQNTSLMPITQIAKDYGMSGTKMNELLHDLGVQYKQGSGNRAIWLLYGKYQSFGYTFSKTQNYVDKVGNPQSKLHTYWTQKGRLFIYDLLKNEGILPMIEMEEIN